MIHYSKQTSPSDIRFSIIIPTWNNLAYLKKCLESLDKNSFYNHQIILHLNEGIDGTVEWAVANNITTHIPKRI